MVGFWSVEVKPEGPVHDHMVAFVELELKVAVDPAQTGPLLVAPVDVGDGFTVTVLVLVPVRPLPSVIVTV